jgi:hypothetical protein
MMMMIVMMMVMIMMVIVMTHNMIFEFYVLLTVHLGIIFVNNQLDAQFFFMYVYFCSLHVSGSHVPIIRRINCINTTSGVSLCIDERLVCRFGLDCVSSKPADVVLIQLILLMMGTWLPETCRE